MRKGSVQLVLNLAVVLVLLTLAEGGAFAAANLALTATATASCEISLLPATNINDGDVSTFWLPTCGPGVDSWLQLSWASTQTFNQLVIRQADSFNDIQTFELQANVGGTWQTVPYTSTTDSSGTITATFSTVTATEVKVVLKAALADGWGSVDISEVEVSLEESNLALSAIPSSSGYDAYGNHDQGINDNVYGQYGNNDNALWLSNAGAWDKFYGYARLAWSSPQTFNQVVVFLGSAGGHDFWTYGAKSAVLQISNNGGGRWTTLSISPDIRTVSNGLAVLRYNLPTSVQATNVRVGFGQWFTSWYDVIVNEIQVWNRLTPNWVTISGKITDSGTGAGISAAQLEITSPSDLYPSNWWNLYDIKTDDAGNFSVLVEPGTYSVEVRGAGYINKDQSVTAASNVTLNAALDRNPAYRVDTQGPIANWSLNADNTENNQGLRLTNWSGPSVYHTAGPTGDQRPCLGLPLDGNTWVGFATDVDFFAGYVDKAWVTVTYWDKGRGIFRFNINRDADPAGYNPAIIAREDSGNWVTRTFPIDLTTLGRRLGYSYDFYLYGDPDPDQLEVSNLSISLQAATSYGDMPVSINFSPTKVENGLIQRFASKWSYPAEAYLTPVDAKGGSNCVLLGANGDMVMPLDVDANRFIGVHDSYVTIEYFDEGTDTLGLQVYRGANPPDPVLYTINKTDSGTWKTWTVWVPDHNFNDRDNSDFAIAPNGDGPDWVRKVTVSFTAPPGGQEGKIGDLIANAPVGSPISLSGKIVTYDYGTMTYWIEEADRAAAIQVIPLSGTNVPAVGLPVRVWGTVGSNDWSGKVIDDAQWEAVGPLGTRLKPLGMTGRTVTSAATGALVNNLYVRIFGTVVDVSDTTGKFIIDDGSGLPGIVVDSWDRPWIQRAEPDWMGKFVIITGVVRGNALPTIVPTIHTSEADILKL